MNILLKEIFAGIFVSIHASHVEIVIMISWVQWQIFEIQQLCIHTQCSGVLYLRVIGGTNSSFIDEGNIFREFLFSRLRFNSRK